MFRARIEYIGNKHFVIKYPFMDETEAKQKTVLFRGMQMLLDKGFFNNFKLKIMYYLLLARKT